MNSINLVGRLVNDPDLVTLPGSEKLASNFRIAVKRPHTKDKSDFFNCVAFGKTGETISQCFTKGNQISITGYATTRNYEDKNKIKRSVTTFVAESFGFIDPKGKDTKIYEDTTPIDEELEPFI